MKDISIIIPVRNENPIILQSLINNISSSVYVREIICVDDGSEKKLGAIYKKIPGIRYIRHSINKGKTAACYTGWKQSHGTYILFIDGDISGLYQHHIDKLHSYMKRYHVVRLYRGGATGIRKLIGLPYIIGGEICFRNTVVRQEQQTIFHGPRWQLEYRINDLLLSGRYLWCIGIVPSMEHTMKWKKKWNWNTYLLEEWGAFKECMLTQGGIGRLLWYRLAMQKNITSAKRLSP